MKNLYLIEDIEKEDIEKISSDNSLIITFDYHSHKLLSNYGIKHKTIDDFLIKNDRDKFFSYCVSCWNWYQKLDNQLRDLTCPEGNHTPIFVSSETSLLESLKPIWTYWSQTWDQIFASQVFTYVGRCPLMMEPQRGAWRSFFGEFTIIGASHVRCLSWEGRASHC